MDWSDWEGWMLADLNLRTATVDEMRRTVNHLTKCGMVWERFRQGPQEARLEARRVLAAKQRAGNSHMVRKCQKALNLLAAYLSDQDERFRGLRWDLSPAPVGRLQPYSPHELARIHEYAHDEPFVERRRRAMLWVCEYTGLRRSELQRIRVEDLDRENSRMRVRPAKEGHPRSIPLHHEAWSPRRPLQAWLVVHPTRAGPLWVSRAGKPLGVNMLSREAWDVSEATGVNVNFNRFRHTRATDLRARGVRLETIGALYGHHNPKSTNHYARSTPEVIESELTRCKVPGFIRQRKRPVEPLEPPSLAPREAVSLAATAL